MKKRVNACNKTFSAVFTSRRLKGIQCRNGTSCPDQLATALEEYKANHAA
ncbi:TSCPD domain-containing protein [Hominenteromicrobium sp.]